MTRGLGAALALLAVTTLGACSSAPARPAPSPPGGPSITQPPAPARERVRFIYTSQGATQAPIWLAQDGGHFLANGLDVELTFVSGSTTATQALLAGEADIVAQGGGATVGAALHGADTLMLATTHGTFVFALATAPGITTFEALRGQSMGVTRFGTTSDFAARYVLQQHGLEPGTDVPLLQTGGNAETFAALQAGAIQAAMVTDVFGFELKRLGYHWLVDLGDLTVEYSHNGVATTRGYVEDNPETIRRLLRAVVQGMGHFVRDPAMAKRVLSRYSHIEDPETLDYAWQAHTTKYLKRVPYTSAAAMKLVLEELGARDERARKAAPEQFYDNRFVRELDESGFIASVYP